MFLNIKTLILAVCLAALTIPCHASGEAMFSKGHSTWSVVGVTCTSGTAADITGALTGYDISAYRLQNQHTAIAVWIGPDVLTSTDSTKSTLGEQLTAGSNGVWELGKNPDAANVAIKIFCKAADSAGQQGVRLSRAIFGFK